MYSVTGYHLNTKLVQISSCELNSSAGYNRKYATEKLKTTTGLGE
jgi:hypothetical protein